LNLVSANNCFNQYSQTFHIGVFPSKLVSVTTDNVNIYNGQTAILRGSGKNNFSWTGPDIMKNWNDSIQVKPTSTSTYMLVCNNNYNCYDTALITIYVTNVGIHNSTEKFDKFSISPNPANDKLLIKINDIDPFYINDRDFIIYNILGQINISGLLDKNETFLDISSLSKGVYFISFDNEVRKFIKD
jgi:hypothetical protein